jgi:hypothetical protein
MPLLLIARSGLPATDVAPAGTAVGVDAEARIAGGRIGDAGALRRHRGRAKRIAFASFGCGAVITGMAIAWQIDWLPGVALFLAGALFDWENGGPASSIRLGGDALVVEAGEWSGLAIPRARITAVEFGAPPLREGASATMSWRGVFGAARSHVVVIGLESDPEGPVRILVPEAGRAEAQAAVQSLRDWWGSGGAA